MNVHAVHHFVPRPFGAQLGRHDTDRMTARDEPARELERPMLGAAADRQEPRDQQRELQDYVPSKSSRCSPTQASIARTASAGDVRGRQPRVSAARRTSET